MSTPSPATQAASIREGSGLFHLDRGLIEVRGADRVRWLNGMLTNDVAVLSPGSGQSGCYALLLTRQGRIVADFHVLARPESFWLDTALEAVPRAIQDLEKFIVADDVVLTDRSKDMSRLGLEGPKSLEVLERAAGVRLAPDPGGWVEVEISGVSTVVARYGFCGGPGFQVLFPLFGGKNKKNFPDVLRALEGAGSLRADAEALEILRIESGIPRFGAELGDDVLPAEARLESAVSTTKGCYTGQEVVERMRSRGKVGHLLVGLQFQEDPPALGEAVQVAGDAVEKVGEVTSSCRSETAGAIALAFVRAAHTEPGTELSVGGRSALVKSLPFVLDPTRT